MLKRPFTLRSELKHVFSHLQLLISSARSYGVPPTLARSPTDDITNIVTCCINVDVIPPDDAFGHLVYVR